MSATLLILVVLGIFSTESLTLLIWSIPIDLFVIHYVCKDLHPTNLKQRFVLYIIFPIYIFLMAIWEGTKYIYKLFADEPNLPKDKEKYSKSKPFEELLFINGQYRWVYRETDYTVIDMETNERYVKSFFLDDYYY